MVVIAANPQARRWQKNTLLCLGMLGLLFFRGAEAKEWVKVTCPGNVCSGSKMYTLGTIEEGARTAIDLNTGTPYGASIAYYVCPFDHGLPVGGIGNCTIGPASSTYSFTPDDQHNNFTFDSLMEKFGAGILSQYRGETPQWANYSKHGWQACGSLVMIRRSIESGDTIIPWNSRGGVFPNRDSCDTFIPIPPPPAPCTVAGGSPMTVRLGEIDRSSIGAGPGKASPVWPLTIQCQDMTPHDFMVRLSMTPTTWANDQIATSNRALGVNIREDGAPLKNNDAFSLPVTGSASKSLTFYVLKNPAVANKAIPTGDFTASATLIITEQ
jgi:minor fimbrial subunit